MPWGRDKDPRVPLGHASLIAVLNMKPEINYHSIIKPINDANFDVIDIFNEIQTIIDKDPRITFDIAFGVYVWAEEAIPVIIEDAQVLWLPWTNNSWRSSDFILR